jgi:hypothetical protein
VVSPEVVVWAVVVVHMAMRQYGAGARANTRESMEHWFSKHTPPVEVAKYMCQDGG